MSNFINQPTPAGNQVLLNKAISGNKTGRTILQRFPEVLATHLEKSGTEVPSSYGRKRVSTLKNVEFAASSWTKEQAKATVEISFSVDCDFCQAKDIGCSWYENIEASAGIIWNKASHLVTVEYQLERISIALAERDPELDLAWKATVDLRKFGGKVMNMKFSHVFSGPSGSVKGFSLPKG
jgi:hypothetical protein